MFGCFVDFGRRSYEALLILFTAANNIPGSSNRISEVG